MVLLVALAGASGAVARYVVHSLVQSRVRGLFPLGTVVINLSGSLVLGFLAGLVIYHGMDPDVRTIVGTGFLGGYTTFSSYSYETLGLVEDGAPVAALGNAIGSVVAGLAAAAAGLALAALV
jgi:fluoride exporter